MKLICVAGLSYLLGSIPFAYIFGKLFKGFDIRRVGSGNVGTTNVFKNVGLLPGILTALGDGGKGALAVLFARSSSQDITSASLIALLFAVIGHNWPIWLHFEGGGGLATCIGGLLFISTGTLLYMGILWGGIWRITRHKYASSLSACAAFPVVMGIYERSWDFFTFGLGMGLALGFKQARAWMRVAGARVTEDDESEIASPPASHPNV